MITNERQHRITKAEIKRFERAIAAAEGQEPAPEVHPRIQEAMVDGLRSQLDELRSELEQYDALREGKVKRRVFTSLLDLPAALIEGRIVRRLTQKGLGQKLGIPEQQIQRYEKTFYAGVSLERLQEVADAVGITVKKTIEYDVKTPASGKASERRVVRQTRSGRTLAAQQSAARESVRANRTGSQPVTVGKIDKAVSTSTAGKALASSTAAKRASRAAASDLAQMTHPKAGGKKATSAAGKALASKSGSKAANRATASDLPRAAAKKKR